MMQKAQPLLHPSAIFKMCIRDRAKKAAEDAEAGVAIPETFKDYLDKWVYSVKDNDELLDKVGGAQLMRLKNEPHLGYSTRH